MTLCSAALCGFLVYGVRAVRSLRAEVRATFDALGRRVSRHDTGIATLGRAVALLVPADARPTAAPVHVAAPPGIPRGAPAPPPPPPVVVAVPPPPVAVVAPPRRDVARELEAAELSEPPVDDTGDRGGINPGDFIPIDLPALGAAVDARPDTEDPERALAELRQRAEAAEDARDAERARRQVPPLLAALSRIRQAPSQAGVDHDARPTLEEVLPRLGDEVGWDDDERTVVGPRPDLTSERPTEAGGAAAAERSKLHRVQPSEMRAARAAWAEETMMSEGVVRATPAAGPGGGPVEGLTQIITPAGLDAGILPPPENDRCALKLVPPPPSDRESPEPA